MLPKAVEEKCVCQEALSDGRCLELLEVLDIGALLDLVVKELVADGCLVTVIDGTGLGEANILQGTIGPLLKLAVFTGIYPILYRRKMKELSHLSLQIMLCD